MITLPPKRWEDGQNPKYDSIRRFRWFKRSEKRKIHIPALKQAYEDMECTGVQPHRRLNQQERCIKWGVDSREYRDYAYFRNAHGCIFEYDRTTQRIIDDAFLMYQSNDGEIGFRECIEKVAPLFNANPRAIVELWETMPDLYPTNYQK